LVLVREVFDLEYSGLWGEAVLGAGLKAFAVLLGSDSGRVLGVAEA
jgi:hypothetical protein